MTLTVLGLAAVAGPLAFGIVRMIPTYAQLLHANGPRPSFVVASVRPSQPNELEGGSVQADNYVARAKTLKQIIEYAYGIGYDHELSGGPAWVSTDRYTIRAKPDDAEREALQKMSRDDRDEQVRLMVQSLLAVRFGLKVSFVKKTLPVYALVIAKGGLKCTSDEDAAPAIPNMAQPRFRWSEGPAPPPPPPGWVPPTPEESRKLVQTTPFHMRTQGWPFWLVVTTLSHQPELGGRTVIDETGLHGSYDCQMYWSPDGSNGPGPSLFTAIQQQMGLKLEPKKAPVEILMIDAIEKPASVDGAEVMQPAQPSPIPAAPAQENTAPQPNGAAEAAANTPNPTFEVSTVKPGTPYAPSSHMDLGRDAIQSFNLPVMFLLQFAYNLNGGSTAQIVDAPSWISSAPFDVTAKMDEGTAARVSKLPYDQRMVALRLMMQGLLAERFQLKLHHETKEMPVLELEVAKGGSKLKAASGAPLGDPSKPPGPDEWTGLHNPERGVTEGRDVPIKLLVDALSNKPEIGGRLVVDRTGLQGDYNFKLEWAPQDGRIVSQTGPSLWTALQEQLGLKLESATAPVECIVIDHVERPSAN